VASDSSVAEAQPIRGLHHGHCHAEALCGGGATWTSTIDGDGPDAARATDGVTSVVVRELFEHAASVCVWRACVALRSAVPNGILWKSRGIDRRAVLRGRMAVWLERELARDFGCDGRIGGRGQCRGLRARVGGVCCVLGDGGICRCGSRAGIRVHIGDALGHESGDSHRARQIRITGIRCRA
jgi:hypothetical protein